MANCKKSNRTLVHMLSWSGLQQNGAYKPRMNAPIRPASGAEDAGPAADMPLNQFIPISRQHQLRTKRGR